MAKYGNQEYLCFKAASVRRDADYLEYGLNLGLKQAKWSVFSD
jgi:hypothetical protein